MKTELTNAQKSKVLHASGLHLGSKSYRDHYCVNLSNDEDMKDLAVIVLEGLMEDGDTINEGRDKYFHLTPKGHKRAEKYKREGVK